MNIPSCITAWIAVLALVQEPTGKTQESTDAIELSRLEHVWNEAHVRGNANALDSLWTDDLVVIVPNMQVMSKQDVMGIMRSGHMKFKHYQTSDLRIRVYGDAAVVSGLLQRTRTIDDRDINENWRFTKMYIRRVGRWQVVAWHASTVAQ